jgi:glycerol-3-phosphate dehydrogenase (NAD+)
MSKLVAENVTAHPTLFEETVNVWVYEEEVTIPKESRHFEPGSELATKPQKLSKLFNTLHENVKYLPGITLPPNVVANTDLVDSCKDSTILVFVLPHQFIPRVCDQLAGKIVPWARAICCTKGVDVSEKGIRLMSEAIGMRLNIYCGALSGANIATEIAQEKYSETTVGCPRACSSEVSTLTLSITGSVRPTSNGLARTDAQGLPQRVNGRPHLSFQTSSQ